MKIGALVWRLLVQNRWLWVLLAAWPLAMAAGLRAGGGQMQAEDVRALLTQECWGGLALAAFAGGALLGNEQRSRRIVLVLTRAMRRREYLGSIWLAAWAPLVVYAFDCACSLRWLCQRVCDARETWLTVATMAAVGALLTSLSLLGSVFLPSALASAGALATLGVLALLPADTFALGDLLPVLMGADLSISAARLLAGWAESVGAAALVLIAAAAAFERRDLDLRQE